MTKRMTDFPTDFSPRWFCPRCGEAYAAQGAARDCDASDGVAEFAVGEVVLVDVGYGWFDGDPKWVLDRSSRESGSRWYSAYFVVTATDFDRRGYSPHSVRYHLKTLGIKNGNPLGLAGWNRPSGWNRPTSHYPMERVPQDPALVAEGSRFLGETYDRML